MRENLAVALVCFASVVEYDLMHLENFAEKILRGGGAIYIAQSFVFHGQTWSREHSTSNHHSSEFRILALHFTDLRNACDVAVVNEWMTAFLIKFFERLEVDCALVLLLAESWVERDLRERRFV